MTVILLILPYLLVADYFLFLGLTLCIAMLIIFFFNFYISAAKDYSFKRRFLEMAALSPGVAMLTFAIGFLIRKTLGIEVKIIIVWRGEEPPRQRNPPRSMLTEIHSRLRSD